VKQSNATSRKSRNVRAIDRTTARSRTDSFARLRSVASERLSRRVTRYRLVPGGTRTDRLTLKARDTRCPGESSLSATLALIPERQVLSPSLQERRPSAREPGSSGREWGSSAQQPGPSS
jgi:hypothetical protein